MLKICKMPEMNLPFHLSLLILKAHLLVEREESERTENKIIKNFN